MRASWLGWSSALATSFCRPSAGMEPEIRHHCRTRGRHLGRYDTRERMRRLAVARRPGQGDAGELADVAHPVIDPHDVPHAGAGFFGNRLGMGIDHVSLKLA